jgi:hypothetical protein
MKLRTFPLACLAAAFLSLPAVTRADTSAIRVRTEQSNKLEANKFTKSASRSLRIYVSNASKETVDLKVKYFLFGRDAKSHDVVTVEQGEKPVQVKGLATEMIETPTAKATAIDEHLDKTKKIEASGIKFVGHAVQVFSGDSIVAEYYDPSTVKEQVGKAGPVPKADAKK